MIGLDGVVALAGGREFELQDAVGGKVCVGVDDVNAVYVCDG